MIGWSESGTSEVTAGTVGGGAGETTMDGSEGCRARIGGAPDGAAGRDEGGGGVAGLDGGGAALREGAGGRSEGPTEMMRAGASEAGRAGSTGCAASSRASSAKASVAMGRSYTASAFSSAVAAGGAADVDFPCAS